MEAPFLAFVRTAPRALAPLLGALLVQVPAAQLFGPQKIISTAEGDPRSVFAADLDGDGDVDVLSASDADDKIAWYEHLASPWAILPYGCGVNPAGSLTVLSGAPSLGTTVAFGVDNPLGTQGVPAASFLALCTAPDPAYRPRPARPRGVVPGLPPGRPPRRARAVRLDRRHRAEAQHLSADPPRPRPERVRVGA